MSQHQKRDLFTDSSKVYKTRLQCAIDNKLPYSTINIYVRKGDIALHFVDNQIKVDEAEVLSVMSKVRRRIQAAYGAGPPLPREDR